MSRRTALVGAGVTLAIGLLWFVLLWRPQRASIAHTKERVLAQEQQVRDLTVRVQRMRRLAADEGRMRQRVEELRAAVPDQPDLAGLVLAINDAASKAGIDFVSISPSPPTDPRAAGAGAGASGPSFRELKLSLSLTGGYPQLLDFLNRLDTLPRIVVVDAISVGAAAQDASTLSVSLQARTFVAAPRAGSPGAPAAGGAPPAVASTRGAG